MGYDDRDINLNINAMDHTQNTLLRVGERLDMIGSRLTNTFTRPMENAFKSAMANSIMLTNAIKPLDTAMKGIETKLGDAIAPLVVSITPAILNLAGHVTDLITRFEQLPIGTQQAIGGFLVFVAAAGPMLQTVSGGIKIIGGFKDIFVTLGVANGGATLAKIGAGATSMGSAIYASLGPIGALILALGTLLTLWNSDTAIPTKQLLTMAAGGAGTIAGWVTGNKTLGSSWAKGAGHSFGLKGYENYANGGSFVVPGSGGGDKPYIMGLSAGEHVNISPAGGRGGGDIYLTVNHNPTYSTATPAEARRFAIEIKQALRAELSGRAG
jgi:hypothetical protein